MEFKGIIRVFVIFFALAFNIGCDQFTKAIVRQKLIYEQPVSVISNNFLLIRTENTGAFLSMANTLVNPYRFILLNFLPALALLGAVGFIIGKKDISQIRLFSIILIIGGGIGNIYDRINHGSVTDFMFIQFGIIHTGVFNVADVSITTGIILLFLTTWLGQRRHAVMARE